MKKDALKNDKPLYLIVGDEVVSPCDHQTFDDFKAWLAQVQPGGKIDRYCWGPISIVHWNEKAGEEYPCLLNPCECGTYLPMDVDSNPMVSSAIELLSDLNRLKQHMAVPERFASLVDTMMRMAEKSLAINSVLEIR